MEIDHLEQVLEIERLSFPIPWSRQAFEFELTRNDFAFYLVLMDADRVVGYAGMWVVIDEGHITNVAVHPDWRGRGLGRRLLQELIRQAKQKGVLRMTLEVRQSNQVARRLYSTLGFVEGGRRRKYYSDNNEDAIIMWLEL
ncbi:MAG: ribosomal protein S18-alanine N-acetyltransferase [Bacillota bacterium]|uniref:ribosomal protein S18-alanine N-acetyltransferase n=1 Tax=Desulfurispora thermophila TaxID=265470 RepID=UPI00037A9F2C|nr:ribosomal protein S18-alanine N-acetyltransferase [Desulfurispora thermophila]